MAKDLEQVWELLTQGSEELALELGVDSFSPAALEVVDEWLAEGGGGLEEEDVLRLGFLLARVLMETHEGGLTRIEEAGHPLEGEWAVSGFLRGLPEDYHVPFLVSATRIGGQRDLGAREWYQALLREARA